MAGLIKQLENLDYVFRTLTDTLNPIKEIKLARRSFEVLEAEIEASSDTKTSVNGALTYGGIRIKRGR